MPVPARRWLERLRRAAAAEQFSAVAAARRGERDAIVGTAIPAGYPGREALLADGYACVDDLPHPALDEVSDAADELARVEGLDAEDATAVLLRRGFTLDES